jgi:hypothetical protein
MSEPRTARNSANAQNDDEPADCDAPRANRKKAMSASMFDVGPLVGPWGQAGTR